MRNVLDKVFGSTGLSLYLGPDAVFGVKYSQRFGRSEVVQYSVRMLPGKCLSRNICDDHKKCVIGVLDELIEKENKSHKLIRVVFDNYYLNYFVFDVEEKPDAIGVERMLRWYTEKKLGGDKEYKYQAEKKKNLSETRIYGAAIKEEFMSTLSEMFDNRNLIWDYAEPLLNFDWVDLDDDIKKKDGAFLVMGYSSWTVIVWGADGNIELVKAGLWSRDEGGKDVLKYGIEEVSRLLTLYGEKNDGNYIEHIYVQPGKWADKVETVTELLPGMVVIKYKNTKVSSPRQFESHDLLHEIRSVCQMAVKL